jgi:O-antigen/teichoic acid export membrane protein
MGGAGGPDDELTSPVAGRVTREETEPVAGYVTGDGVELAGAGRDYGWAVLPLLAKAASQLFLVGYLVTRLGIEEFGAAVTAIAAVAILNLLSEAVRITATRDAARAVVDPGGEAVARVLAAHNLYLLLAAGMPAAGLVIGGALPGILDVSGAVADRLLWCGLVLGASASVVLCGASSRSVLASRRQFAILSHIGLAGVAVRLVTTVALLGELRLVAVGAGFLAAAVVESSLYVRGARRHAPWLALRPSRAALRQVRDVMGYTSATLVLFATSTIVASSDALVIGALVGAAAVGTYQVGATSPTQAAALFHTAAVVMLPSLSRVPRARAQEVAMRTVIRALSWLAATAYAAVAMLSADIVELLLGHADGTAQAVLILFCAGLALDACYSGVVQVMYARGRHTVFARWSLVELGLNLALTVLLVALFGAIGAGVAALVTFAFVDLVLFPVLMRGEWGEPAGRYVIRHGLVPAAGAAALVAALGVLPVVLTDAVALRLAAMAVICAISVAVGFLALGSAGRAEVAALLRARSPAAR